MRVGLVILTWTARHAFALVLIVLLLLTARHLAGPTTAWLGEQSEALRAIPAQQAAYAEASRAFELYAEGRAPEVNAQAAVLAGRSEAELRARDAALEPEIARQMSLQLSPPQLALAGARGDGGAVFTHFRAQTEVALLQRERRYIAALLSSRTAERERLSLDGQRRATRAQLDASHQQRLAAQQRVTRLERRFMADARNSFCRLSPVDVGCTNYRALVTARREMEIAAARNRDARARLAGIDQAEAALRRGGGLVESAGAVLASERAKLFRETRRLEEVARRNPTLSAWRAVASVLPAALLILAGAMVAPLLMKTVLFFGVAPLAARCPPIRLLKADRGEVSMLSDSAVSQRVALSPTEDLLVLPQAVQSTPHHADKRTRWLLSWAMPLSSLAAGMVALTQFRVKQPDTVLVSATGGPLMEIALIRLQRGSALVLRPRALRGMLQPSAEPVRITRRWRLSLSALLTLQLRCLIFHGPCTLVVEGARGVRLERAGAGRGISQAATIGFSAGLAYAVSRTETFGAYLLGRRALFNDSFDSDAGSYLYEELPLEARPGGMWTGGLRGLSDAALKIVGL